MGIGISNVSSFQMINTKTGEVVLSGNVNNLNVKENIKMEEKLNKYLVENEIKVDENGNFEMFVVVDADDKDHTVGTIFNGKETEVYSEERAYEDLKENNVGGYISSNPFLFNIPTLFSSKVEPKKKTTIRDDLLKLEDKMFKVLVNVENITDLIGRVVYVNKYKVLEEIVLNSTLKYKVKSISSDKVTVLLYNSLTEKSKTIEIDCNSEVNSLEDVKELINKYLENDEKKVALINSIIEDGAEL
jgi:hypothetical protein